MVAAYVVILGDQHRFADVGVMNVQGVVPAPVTIGDNVWLGTQSIVMNGVNIASGAIVGAGTVVTKDVPEKAIVTGVAGQVQRYR